MLCLYMTIIVNHVCDALSFLPLGLRGQWDREGAGAEVGKRAERRGAPGLLFLGRFRQPLRVAQRNRRQRLPGLP